MNNRIDLSQTANIRIRTIISLLIILAFIVIAEEISWGQRIFGWSSEGVFSDYNYQEETNLHNFFNPILSLFYPLLGMTTFVFLVIIWISPSKSQPQLLRFLLPSRSLFVIALFLASSSFGGNSEIFETYFTLFFLFYSINLYSKLIKTKAN
jgi:hypothetical protein